MAAKGCNLELQAIPYSSNPQTCRLTWPLQASTTFMAAKGCNPEMNDLLSHAAAILNLSQGRSCWLTAQHLEAAGSLHHVLGQALVGCGVLQDAQHFWARHALHLGEASRHPAGPGGAAVLRTCTAACVLCNRGEAVLRWRHKESASGGMMPDLVYAKEQIWMVAKCSWAVS